MTGIPVSTRKVDAGRAKGPQNVPNVIEIRVQMQLPNLKPSFWTVHGSYATASPNLPSTALALFSSIGSAWSTNLALYMSTATLFQAVFLRDMSNFTLPVYEGTGAAIAGTSALTPMPSEAAIVMTENIAARGRGAKGRVYLGGWTTLADAGEGLISQAAHDAINTFGLALASAINAQSLTPCVAQLPRNQYQGVTGTVHAQRPANHVTVQNYVCRDFVWDSQRRRSQP